MIHIAKRARKRSANCAKVALICTKIEKRSRSGLLFASGLITGEALIGILLAIPIVLSGKPDVLAIMKKPVGAWPGIVLLIGIGYWLCRVALGNKERKA